MNYVVNPYLEFRPFYGSGSQQKYLCETPRMNGTIRRDLVDPELGHLLPLFDGNRNLETVLEKHKLAYPASRYTEGGLRKLVDNFCIPNSILLDPSALAGFAAAPPAKAPGGSYLYARLKLLPHDVIYPIARSISWLYARPTLVFLIGLASVMHLWLYWRLLPASGFNLAAVREQQFLALTAVLIVCSFLHELGHATALARHGCKRLEIGLGLYLYFPVLYTDVSEAWRLKPAERVAVDAGGVYFHLISQLLLLAGYYLSHQTFLLYAIFMIDITIISCLNPLLRMDGYWLLSDLCGMWNLRKQSLDLGRYCWRRLTGRRPLPDLSGMSTRTMRILIAYSVIFAYFFIYLVITMAYQVVVHVIPGYPGLWLRLGQNLLHPASLDIKHWLSQIFELLWNTFLITGCCLFARNTLRRVVRWWGARGDREVPASGYRMTAAHD